VAAPALASDAIVSVNVSRVIEVGYRGRKIRTGIFKSPVSGCVAVHHLGLNGDTQADLRVHGGLDKAVYAYAAEHYDFWEFEMSIRYPFGQFGENLTVTGVAEDRVRAGDVFRAGGALFQVTGPRFPCFKLGIRMGDQKFLKRFLESGRSGFYLRVLEEGDVSAGDLFELVETRESQPTIRALVAQYR